jgi:signal transduction histidine kinase
LTEFEKYASATGGVFNRTINCEIRIPKGTMIRMDKQLVSRALENIFSNAIRYTQPQAKIDARAFIEGGFAKITISDNGIGMTQEEAERAFELFYRGTHSRREQGQGIGLSVVKTVMDIHGWEIGVKSEKGAGTCFTIKIPIIS